MPAPSSVIPAKQAVSKPLSLWERVAEGRSDPSQIQSLSLWERVAEGRVRVPNNPAAPIHCRRHRPACHEVPSPQPSPRGRGGSFDTAWKAGIQGRRGGAPAKLPAPHPAWIPAFAGMTCSGLGAGFAPIMESCIPGCLVGMTPRPPVSVFLPRGSCPAKAYSLSSQALLV